MRHSLLAHTTLLFNLNHPNRKDTLSLVYRSCLSMSLVRTLSIGHSGTRQSLKMSGFQSSISTKNSTPVLQECLFQWCSKTIRSSVKDEFSKEEAVGDTTIRFDGQPQSEYDPAEIYFNTSDGKTITLRNYTTQILRDRIQNDMPRTLVQDDRYPFVPSGGVWNFHHEPPYDINPVFTNLTTAITNNLRSRVHGTEQVDGIAWANVAFIETRWACLSLPLGLLLGSLVLLCATILKSQRSGTPAWKSSALAALLHGPGEETQSLMAANALQSEIEAISEKLYVQLTGKDGSKRLKAA